MEIDTATLRISFENMQDDQLLRRWHGPLTDEARLVAQQEIERRGIEVSNQAYSRLLANDEDDKTANRRRQKKYILGVLLRVVLGIFAAAGSAIALLIFGGR